MSLIVTMLKTKKLNDAPRKMIEKKQNERLRKLVNYARKNSDFYA